MAKSTIPVQISIDVDKIIELLKDNADVVEVRHGRWEHLGGDEWCCTACGHVISTEGSWERPWQKYCEECGAKMVNEDDE